MNKAFRGRKLQRLTEWVLGHLAFEVEDVRTTLAHLLAAGGSTLGSVVEREIEGVGLITFVYACDPEGNIIELQSWEKDISE